MKKSKYVNLLATSAVMLSALAPMTALAEENKTTEDQSAGLNLIQGDFILEVTNITSFGTHEIKSYKQVVTAGFDEPFTVIDARGTQEGWDLTVSSKPFTIIEPEGGWVKENPYQLPLGSLSLNTLDNIKGVYGEKKEIHPIIDELGVAIDLGQEVRVSHASQGKGMGQYALTHAAEALELVIDPVTAKVDKVNYPDSVTPYETTITWNLVSGPGTESSNPEGNTGNTGDNGDNGDNGNTGDNGTGEELEGGVNTDEGQVNNGEGEQEELKQEVKTFSLEQSKVGEDTYVITLEDLDEIIDIKASNGGQVEIVSIEGNQVTLRITGGTPVGTVVISGEYVEAKTKTVTAQDYENYSDSEGYVGTLTKYVYSGQASDTQYFEAEADGGTSYQPVSYVGYTMPYSDGAYSGTLSFISERVVEIPGGVNLNVDYTSYATDANTESLKTLVEADIIASLQKEHPYLKNIVVNEMYWDSATETGSFSSGGTSYAYKREATVKITVDGYQTLVTLGGNLTSPDTRVYKYEGTVTKPAVDTRQYANVYQYDVEVNYKKK